MLLAMCRAKKCLQKRGPKMRAPRGTHSVCLEARRFWGLILAPWNEAGFQNVLKTVNIGACIRRNKYEEAMLFRVFDTDPLQVQT